MMRTVASLRTVTAMMAAAALAAAVLAAAPGDGGQDPAPEQPQPTFRAGVNLVRLDVSVVDGDGVPITDLQPADFEIEEDDVVLPAETVQFVRLDGQPPAGATEALPIRSREHAELEAARDDVRIFAIFFDEYHVDKAPPVTLPMRAALRAFVEGLGPTDLVAVMDPLTPLSALEFTRSRRELIERVEAFEGRRGEYFPVRSPMEEAQLASGRVNELRAGVSLSALNALVTYLGGLREGRKSVLFVSQGPPTHAPGTGLRDMLDEVLRSANRSNVTINVFDPRALGSGVFGGTESISVMASETGGRKIVNTNAPAKALVRIIDDASAYYLVGYTPPRDFADGQFHRVEVRVKRRGAQVTARRGYWAPDASEMTPAVVAPEAPGLRESLATLAASNERRALTVWVGVARGDAGRTRIVLSWDPTERAGSPGAGAVRLDVEPQDGSGEALAPLQSIASSTAAVPGTSSLATFELPPGDVTLHLEARDEAGAAVDRWADALRVPDLAEEPLALATPRFLRARSPFELRALLAADAPVPTASRNFRRTHRVFVDVQCYHAPGVSPTVRATLLNDSGDVLAPLSLPPLEEGHARVEIPMGSLAIGGYVLRIDAEAGEHRTQRLTAFRVVP